MKFASRALAVLSTIAIHAIAAHASAQTVVPLNYAGLTTLDSNNKRITTNSYKAGPGFTMLHKKSYNRDQGYSYVYMTIKGTVDKASSIQNLHTCTDNKGSLGYQRYLLTVDTGLPGRHVELIAKYRQQTTGGAFVNVRLTGPSTGFHTTGGKQQWLFEVGGLIRRASMLGDASFTVQLSFGIEYLGGYAAAGSSCAKQRLKGKGILSKSYSPVEFEISNLPAPKLAVLLLGDNPANVSLNRLGATGCSLLVGSPLVLPMFVSSTTASSGSIRRPPLRRAIYAQGIVFDPKANAAGLVTTNSIRAYWLYR